MSYMSSSTSLCRLRPNLVSADIRGKRLGKGIIGIKSPVKAPETPGIFLENHSDRKPCQPIHGDADYLHPVSKVVSKSYPSADSAPPQPCCSQATVAALLPLRRLRAHPEPLTRDRDRAKQTASVPVLVPEPVAQHSTPPTAARQITDADERASRSTAKR